jgi:hypothetical protein
MTISSYMYDAYKKKEESFIPPKFKIVKTPPGFYRDDMKVGDTVYPLTDVPYSINFGEVRNSVFFSLKENGTSKEPYYCLSLEYLEEVK